MTVEDLREEMVRNGTLLKIFKVYIKPLGYFGKGIEEEQTDGFNQCPVYSSPHCR